MTYEPPSWADRARFPQRIIAAPVAALRLPAGAVLVFSGLASAVSSRPGSILTGLIASSAARSRRVLARESEGEPSAEEGKPAVIARDGSDMPRDKVVTEIDRFEDLVDDAEAFKVFAMSESEKRRGPWFVPPRLYKDWVALNARSTARHILLRTREECLNAARDLAAARSAGEFVVDAFAAKARACSLDDETRESGGLLGTRMRQGECRLPELDKACFCGPLGRVAGPVRSREGFHLVLVEERLGLEYYDDGMSRVLPLLWLIQ